MHRELTVREILDTYAFLRLPAAYTAAERDHVVSDVIDCLQLTHVSDSTIGDEAKRGISGGQRKRVNVGMEMVADPSLLFLDEPTSGLDSTTSFDLVTALKALAAKGCNVITVLHQPSYPLYQMFSSVLLLGKGGKTVYLGPGEHAMTYFNQCGYEMPPLLNPVRLRGEAHRPLPPTARCRPPTHRPPTHRPPTCRPPTHRPPHRPTALHPRLTSTWMS